MNSQDQQSAHKKHKKRTKNLLMQLKDQIDFYFSDANLQKDRFLNQEVSKHPDGYIAVSIIASFNRMKQKTSDISLVVKAMKMSSLLEVSEDDSMVRRKTAVPEPKNVDKETIYVERLPPNADHDWLKEIFSKCGKVLYVSIPRYKHTGDIKGFAFVEFESAEQAKDAIQMFNKGNKQSEGGAENGSGAEQSNEQQKTKGKRRRSHSESEVDTQKHKERKRKRTTSESSVDSGEADQQAAVSSSLDIKQKRKEVKPDVQLIGGEGVKRKESEKSASSDDQERRNKKGKKSVRWEEGEEEENKSEKEKKSVESSVVSSTTGVKRRREDDNDDGDDGNDNDDDETKAAERKRRKSGQESEPCGQRVEEETVEGEAGAESKKHKRKRKKKEKKESKLPHLRVISKLEWLNLKKEYKNLQRQAMKNLKQQLQEKCPTEPNPVQGEGERKPQKTDTEGKEEERNNKEKEQSNKEKEQSSKEKEQSIKESGEGLKELSYTPGVVLKIQCKKQGTTKKELRETLSSRAPVAYLDLAEDTTQGYVRFHTVENCNLVWNEMSAANDDVKLDRLTEEEEKAYWDKINADRKARFNSKREKKRGTEKVARKAEALQMKLQSHIRFDDGEG